MDANFTCLEQRLDNITANGKSIFLVFPCESKS